MPSCPVAEMPVYDRCCAVSSMRPARRKLSLLRVEEVGRMRRLVVLALLTILCLMLRASSRM